MNDSGELVSPKAIDVSLCLVAALHFFASGSYLDIFTNCGMCVQSVYASAWALVDTVNNCPDLEINPLIIGNKNKLQKSSKGKLVLVSISALDVWMV